MSRHRRATIEFDDGTTNMFQDLVIETLEQSEFIETEWDDGTLIVYEPMPDNGLTETPEDAVALAPGRTPEEVEEVRDGR
jgi:hypothetical protein